MEEMRKAREETRRVSKELAELRSSTALALALSGETGPGVYSPISPEALAEHPERAQALLEAVAASADKREEQFPDAKSELDTLRGEANGALKELHQSKENRLGKPSLRVAELAARALASAAGLGLGVAGYDILKEIVKTLRERSSLVASPQP